MPHELLRDVLRTSDPADTRRRWGLVPVSIAAHAAALSGLVIMPLVADIDLPSPSSVVRLVQAAPPPIPPSPVVPPARVTPVARDTAAPISAASTITEEPPVAVAEPGPPGLIVDPNAATVTGGIPDALVSTAAPPPAPPAPQGPMRVGGAIREPRPIVRVPPEYPPLARAARVEGTVVLEAVIDERGSVTRVRVLSSNPLLDDAAIRAVRQWRYTPTLLNNVPVQVLMTITITFKLQ